MVRRCCVKKCRSADNRKDTEDEDLSFHRFPSNNSLKQKWIEVLKENNTFIDTPKNHHYVCRKHFSSDQFTKKNCFFILKDSAIPCIFNTSALINNLSKNDSNDSIMNAQIVNIFVPVMPSTVQQLHFTSEQLLYVQNLLEQLAAMEEEKKQSDKEIGKMKVEILARQQKIWEMREQVQQSQQEINILRSQNCKLEHKVIIKQVRLNNARTKGDNLQAVFRRLKRKCLNLQMTVKDLKKLKTTQR